MPALESSNKERMENTVTIGTSSPSAAPQEAAEGLIVTPSAVKRIHAILAKEGIPFTEGGLRLGVKGGGFVYLRGMKLDYEETLMRQGFNFINPNSARSCGCGTSFSV